MALVRNRSYTLSWHLYCHELAVFGYFFLQYGVAKCLVDKACTSYSVIPLIKAKNKRYLMLLARLINNPVREANLVWKTPYLIEILFRT